MKRAGLLRPAEVRAQIALIRLAHTQEINWDTDGYWHMLNYYGPVALDSLAQLKRHISNETYAQINEIISVDDDANYN